MSAHLACLGVAHKAVLQPGSHMPRFWINLPFRVAGLAIADFMEKPILRSEDLQRTWLWSHIWFLSAPNFTSREDRRGSATFADTFFRVERHGISPFLFGLGNNEVVDQVELLEFRHISGQ